MGEVLLSVVFTLSVFFLSLAPSAYANGEVLSSWQGKYEYQDSIGQTVGGTAVLVDMTLTVSADGKCELLWQGYQRDDDIICKLLPNKKGLDIGFVSYSNGSITYPATGVAVYQPDDVLFSLSKQGNNLLTRWAKIRPHGVKQSGEFFIAK